MKRVWIACAILLAIFSATILHGVHIASFTRELTTLLESAEASAEAEDWDRAAELTQTAWDKWDQKALYLHVTLHHDETDQIYTGLREVTEFIQCREGGEYSAANARLIANLELMAEAEQLNVKNIL